MVKTKPEKPVTLTEVAARAGVSTSTASRALAGSPSISELVRLRVTEAARAMDYSVPPRKKRSDVSRSLITVVMPPRGARPLPDPFILELLGGLIIALRERNQDFVISHVVPTDDGELNALIDANSDGAFIILGQAQYHKALNRQARLGRAVVVWGPELDQQQYCSVGSNNVLGAAKLVRHLLRAGRRKIAFIGLAPYDTFVDRFNGYQSALNEAGLTIDQRLVRQCDAGYDDAFDPVNDLLDGGTAFDAIFASNDMLALGVLRALRMRGVRVPDDVAVVGYDDIASARHASPPLTTVQQDVLRAGQLLVTKLLRRRNGQSALSERLPTEMIVRESCGG